MTSDVFSIEGYRRLIQQVRASGYALTRFGDPPTSERRLYLRHDVDVSPRMARALGAAAAELGVHANFFFLVNGETYDVFSEETRATIRELRAAGHVVGLHIDQRVFGEEEPAVEQTVTWFERCVEPVDRVVSFHRPHPTVLGRRYDAVTNAYAPEFFGEGRYFSDSRRSEAFVQPLTAAMEQGLPCVQLLLHPEWWSRVEDVAELYELLAERRRWEFDDFLATNFAKVFGPLVRERRPHAYRPPGV